MTVLAGSFEAVVDRVGVEGDGVCRTGSGQTVFAPFVLPGERVQLKTMGERAELVEVLEASAERVDPPCPHFFACGGCALQHWSAAPYLDWKSQIIERALAREGLSAPLAAPFAAAPGTRRRLTLHARKGDRGAVRLGFKARRSWSLVEIETCVIADPRLVAALPALRRLAGPFLEHAKSAPSLHVTVTETGLDVDITGVERRSGGLSADARMRAAGIAASTDLARVTLAGEVVFQSRQPMVRLGRAMAALPPGGFLQAVPAAEAAMADFALKAMGGAGRIADLFCGLGTFALRLAEQGTVMAVDADEAAVKALAVAAGPVSGLKSISVLARDLLRRPMLAQDLKKIDAVLFDPPRAGAELQAGQLAQSKVPVVVGVSCDPRTFARDARILVAGGFALEQVMMVDQFLWSPHVELVGVFKR